MKVIRDFVRPVSSQRPGANAAPQLGAGIVRPSRGGWPVVQEKFFKMDFFEKIYRKKVYNNYKCDIISVCV